MSYRVFNAGDGAFVKAWVHGVPVEAAAEEQLLRTARMPFVHKWVAAMPDVHVGKGATVGSVIPTEGALIPAAVGVDLGCGMMAARTTLRASDLPDNLEPLRAAIERAVPHGRTGDGRPEIDRGAWHDSPEAVLAGWAPLAERYQRIAARHPKIARGVSHQHLGTLGTGNHFVELCLGEREGPGEDQAVWFMLHSGSRGVGNRIGSYFIELARQEMRRWFIHLPDADLAYLVDGTTHFTDYVEAVGWAQDFAAANRRVMMDAVLGAARSLGSLPAFSLVEQAVNCHHNYVAREHHYGKNVWVTRKGAVRARRDDLGIIPGSMGACSYIVRGRGNPEAFDSCSHGAGRAMSRTEARRRFTVEDHVRATEGVACRKDADVVDETPAAYKSIEAVMEAQQDLVEVLHRLKQVLCVKG